MDFHLETTKEKRYNRLQQKTGNPFKDNKDNKLQTTTDKSQQTAYGKQIKTEYRQNQFDRGTELYTALLTSGSKEGLIDFHLQTW